MGQIFTIKFGEKEMRLDLDYAKSNHRTVGDSLKASGLYETETSLAFLRLLREGDVFADVGANLGYFTILGSLLVGRSGRVAAFEPAEENLRDLRINLALNAAENVTVVEKIVAEREGTRKFHINSDDHGGMALWDPGLFPTNEKSRENPLSREIAATTLDEEFAGRTPPRLIKIDTEGAEQVVLMGAAGLLASGNTPFVIAELHEFGLKLMGHSQRSLRNFMRTFGYETYLPDGGGGTPRHVPMESNIQSPYFINMLFALPRALDADWK
jgi:FkbM family methyltransferase